MKKRPVSGEWKRSDNGVPGLAVSRFRSWDFLVPDGSRCFYPGPSSLEDLLPGNVESVSVFVVDWTLGDLGVIATFDPSEV